MNYQNYSTEDFLLDKKFRDWVEKPDEESDLFWYGFLAKHPEKMEDVNSAKDILQKMQFRNYTLDPDEVSGLWSSILKEKNTTIFEEEKGLPLYQDFQFEAQKHQRKSAVNFQLISIAAALSVFLIITGLYWWLRANSEHIYTTAYGQTTEIRLSDGSMATLNANSTLKVPKHWNDDIREVWLEGEAFFQVKASPQNSNFNQQIPEKFVVHTQGIAVEVLGTQFNVNTRREKIQVVLSSGKVKLKWQEREFLMQPGELVEVSQTDNEVSQKQVNPETYSSWKDNHLLCDATPLSELVKTAEDRFGYEMIFQDNSLRDIKVSGTIPLDSLEIFNLVLSRLIEAKFQQKGNQVIISK